MLKVLVGDFSDWLLLTLSDSYDVGLGFRVSGSGLGFRQRPPSTKAS